MQFIELEDVVGGVNIFGDVGGELKQLGSCLVREEDVQECNEEVVYVYIFYGQEVVVVLEIECYELVFDGLGEIEVYYDIEQRMD